jgi:hypothetical protein
MTASREPSLAEVLRLWFAAHDARLRVCMPGRVERYDATQRRADVKPLVKASYEDAAGTRRADSLPVVPSVPVVFPGAGGFTLTFPVQPGDTVLLVFADESLDRWLSRGGEVDPGEVRPHDLSNAVALVGLQSFANALAAHADNVVLGKPDGARVEITSGGEIHAHAGGATDFVALAERVHAELDALRSALNTHTHPVATAGTALAQTGTAAANPSAAPSPIGSVAASKVKAE